jgi:7,8-dihydroneopterin aldolase/epimerase/oxygenase
MSVSIELTGIELYGYHGVLPDERLRGQRFLVDVVLACAEDEATRSDAIGDAVDYRDLVETVREVSSSHAYNLLEAFAAAVADALLERFPVVGARVRVHKPDLRLDPPVDHAAVVVERTV